jgi:hypothetical protein
MGKRVYSYTPRSVLNKELTSVVLLLIKKRAVSGRRVNSTRIPRGMDDRLRLTMLRAGVFRRASRNFNILPLALLFMCPSCLQFHPPFTTALHSDCSLPCLPLTDLPDLSNVHPTRMSMRIFVLCGPDSPEKGE